MIWREYHQPHYRQATEMPQKAAFREGRRIIQAWEADHDVWSEARAASRSGDLVMPCCGVRATAKTSHLGFRFFAHRPVPDNTCLWADQSTEHERLKVPPAERQKRLGSMHRRKLLLATAHGAPAVSSKTERTIRSSPSKCGSPGQAPMRSSGVTPVSGVTCQ